jgi:Family of unknown function (DUF6519)
MIGDMYGDFSRLTFAPEKHFSAVLVQQGRVLLDADANEQTAVTLHYLRRLATDLIGPYGGPAGAHGFEISFDGSVLEIGAGHYYVHGLLCEVDEPTTYFDQPDAFLDPDEEIDRLPDVPYLVYLKVWERHVTAVEDPSIRELALGENAPDTAARSKVVWQVLASADWPPGSGKAIGANVTDARTTWDDWQDTQVEGKTIGGEQVPRLRAKARELSEDDLDPCMASPEARYRGVENQLYRVEIHDGGNTDTATFKWSRDNGAAVFPLESLSGPEATVASLGRDRDLGLEVEDWVELLDDRSVLRGERHELVHVDRIDPLDRLVFLEDLVQNGVGQDPGRHPFLRRWDQQEGPVVDVVEGEWIELEDGIEIAFEQGGFYTPGDYWLIPARTASGDVDWPRDANGDSLFRPPLGIRYYCAPLAFVDGVVPNDMRSTFKALTAP